MKKLAIALCLATAVFAQVNPCSYTTQLTGGTTVEVTSDWQKTGSIPGTDFEYYLWHNKNDNSNKVTLKYYGANQGGGAAFRGEWNEPNTKFDYLARVGLQFEKNGNGSGKLYTEYGDIFADYSYDRSSRLNGQNYSYIGIYGWARAGNGANLVEYYIVDDWWGNQSQSDATPVGIATTGGSQIGQEVEIDGAKYKIIKNSRTGQPSIEGDATNFDQYFSIRQTPRKCGTISITEHFKAWEKAGLKLGKLYEAKLLAEVGAYGVSTSQGYIDYRYASMRIGGGTSTPSSNSTGGTSSSSKASSSSGATHTQATTCKTPLITYPTNSVPSDPYTACFKYTNNKCYVCKVANEVDGNTCASSWVWNGSQIESNLTSGYWYQEVTCPATSSSSAATATSSSSKASSSSAATAATSSSSKASSSSATTSSSSSTETESSSSNTSGSDESSSSEEDITPIANPSQLATSHSPTYYSLKGEPLGTAKPQKAGVYIVKEGHSVKKIAVR